MVEEIGWQYILGITLTVAAIIGGWIWQSRTRKDKMISDRRSFDFDVERTAREKGIAERGVAKELAEHSEKLALDVKQSMKEHISQLIITLKQDIELQRTIIYSKIDTLDVKIQQNKIDLAEHIKDYHNLEERITHSIEFLQTMAWGPDAKSVPAYMQGEEETEAHRAKPGVGAFRDRTKEEQEDIDQKKTVD